MTTAADLGVALEPRAGGDPAPFTYTQQWLWRALDLAREPGMRMVAPALRLSGRPDIGCLRQTLLLLLRRHEALRTRIVMAGDVPLQAVARVQEPQLPCVDLTAVADSAREAEALRVITELVYRPTALFGTPLFSAQLVKLKEDEHVFVLAMEHLISDAASAGILMRELVAIYRALSSGRSCELPAPAVQLADYALWQQRTRSAWQARHGPWWSERLAGARALQPFCSPGASQGPSRWSVQALRIDPQVSAGLRAVAQHEGLSLAFVLLSIYAALILSWSGESEAVIAFMTAGRQQLEIKDTVGFFAAPLFLRIQAAPADRFRDLIRNTHQEYRAAAEHHDCAALLASTPPPACASNPGFNFLPAGFRLLPPDSDSAAQPAAIRATPYDLPVSMREGMQWSYNFVLRTRDHPDGVLGAIAHRSDCVTAATLERFTGDFQKLARALAADPDAPLADALSN